MQVLTIEAPAAAQMWPLQPVLSQPSPVKLWVASEADFVPAASTVGDCVCRLPLQAQAAANVRMIVLPRTKSWFRRIAVSPDFVVHPAP